MIDFQARIHDRLAAENDAESHIERDTYTFHPSYLARCKRTGIKNKFGLETHDPSTLWNFKLGHWIHEYAETLDVSDVEQEYPCYRVLDDEGLILKGTTDVYEPAENAVYDFKSRASWYNFDPPSDAHLNQLTLYMAMTGARKAQVVYILKKGPYDPDEPFIKTWPADGFAEYDPTRYQELIDKALHMRQVLEQEGIPETLADVPFEPCQCFICRGETDG